MTEIEAMYIDMNHTPTSLQSKERQIGFLQRARARKHAVKQAAEDMAEALGLPHEACYEMISTMFAPPKAQIEPSAEQQSGQENPWTIATSFYENSSEQHDHLNVDITLKRFDSYIIALACKTVTRHAIRADLVEDEADELAQMIRIKLWQALQKNYIMSLKSYIRTIAHSEYIRMLKQLHFTIPLLLDAEGELIQGNIVAATLERTEDPAKEVEQEETVSCLITSILQTAGELPYRQRYAVLCALAEYAKEDTSDRKETLRRYQIDIEQIHWPDEKEEMQRLRASLSIARKKLREAGLGFAQQ